MVRSWWPRWASSLSAKAPEHSDSAAGPEAARIFATCSEGVWAESTRTERTPIGGQVQDRDNLSAICAAWTLALLEPGLDVVQVKADVAPEPNAGHRARACGLADPRLRNAETVGDGLRVEEALAHWQRTVV